MTALKRLVNSTATYALANVINSAIPFLLLPVLTRVLEPTEYGLVAMFTTIITVFSAFTGLSLHGAVSVRYFNTETDHPRFVGSCLAVLSCSTAIVLTVVWILSDFLSGLVGLPRAWLLLAVLGASFQALINIRLVMWQIKGVAIRYGFFQVFQTLFNLGFSLWLVIFVGLGWEGRGWGVLSALLIFGAIAVFSLFASGLASRHISGEYVRASLKFGVPLIPHSVGGLMTAISDRFILVALIGLASAGSYVVGAQVGMAVALLADAFNKAFAPYLLRELQRLGGRADLALARQCIVVFAGFLFLSCLFVFCAPLVYKIFIGLEYYESLVVAQLIGFGNAFLGMYYVVSGFIFYSEKTALLSKLTLICGVLNLGITYLMVLALGAVGAAIGYCVIQMVFFCGALRLCQSVCPIPWGKAFLSFLGIRGS
jgi:O-antigen/teichoic acid export membrane protein